MEIIGETPDGRLIIIVSPEEITTRGAEKVIEVSDQPDSLYIWSSEFRKQLSAWIGAPLRAINPIRRAAEVLDTKWEDHKLVKTPPHLRNASVFTRHGRLLDFDEWCKAVVYEQVDVQSVPMMGEAKEQELKAAIQKYLKLPS